MRLEEVIYSAIDNARRQMQISPLLLGGVTASAGGSEGRPGGYIGQLPQHKVTYDLSELATLDTSISGESLVDNLNHIRYRVQTLEEAPEGGISEIKQDNTVLATGITVLDFSNQFILTEDPVGEINLDIVAQNEFVYGLETNTNAEGQTEVFLAQPFRSLKVYNENLSSQISTAISGIYNLTYNYIYNTVRLYYNGLRQMPNTYTVLSSGSTGELQLLFTPDSTDYLLVDYDYYLEEQYGWGNFWGGVWG